MTEQPSDQRAPTAPLQSTEHTVTLEDGTALFYRAWLPDTPFRHALLLFGDFRERFSLRDALPLDEGGQGWG